VRVYLPTTHKIVVRGTNFRPLSDCLPEWNWKRRDILLQPSIASKSHLAVPQPISPHATINIPIQQIESSIPSASTDEKAASQNIDAISLLPSSSFATSAIHHIADTTLTATVASPNVANDDEEIGVSGVGVSYGKRLPPERVLEPLKKVKAIKSKKLAKSKISPSIETVSNTLPSVQKAVIQPIAPPVVTPPVLSQQVPVQPAISTPIIKSSTPPTVIDDSSLKRSSRLAAKPKVDYAAVSKNKVNANAAKSARIDFDPDKVPFVKGITGSYKDLCIESTIKELNNIFVTNRPVNGDTIF
jgi:hypothetical protein